MIDITDFFPLALGAVGLLLSMYPVWLALFRGGVEIPAATTTVINLLEKGQRDRARKLCKAGERDYFMGTVGRMLDASRGLQGAAAAEQAAEAFRAAFDNVRSRQKIQLLLAIGALPFLVLALLSTIAAEWNAELTPMKLIIIGPGLLAAIVGAWNVRKVRRKLPLGAEQLISKLKEID